MDSRAARVLQVRVALGAKVGARVTLVSSEEQHLLSHIGQSGEVTSLNDDGTISVRWANGDESTVEIVRSRLEVHS
jgi:hypothetical protein